MIEELIRYALRKIGYAVHLVKLNPASTPSKKPMYGKLVAHDAVVDTFVYSVAGHKANAQFASKLKEGTYQIVSCACPICAGNEFTNIASSKEGFKWGICNSCGLLQITDRMRNEDINSFYESGEYQVICMGGLDDKVHFALEQKVASLYFFDVLEQIGIPVCGLSVMEIGCGSGGILLAFKGKGAKVKGYDIDTYRVEYGRRYLPELECADAMANEVEWPADLRLLIVSNVLEHLTDPQEFMNKIGAKITNSDIKVLIDVPNLDGISEYSDKTLDFLHIGHLWYFNAITIDRLLNQAGFRVDYIFNRGASFSVICVKADRPIENRNSAFWCSVSAINYANIKNDLGSVSRKAKVAYDCAISERGVCANCK